MAMIPLADAEMLPEQVVCYEQLHLLHDDLIAR
jgi:hypothetical protein